MSETIAKPLIFLFSPILLVEVKGNAAAAHHASYYHSFPVPVVYIQKQLTVSLGYGRGIFSEKQSYRTRPHSTKR